MIMKLQCPITKILLPIDGSGHSKRALQFAGCMGASLGKSLSGITLLHVITGGYLSRHISHVDFRAELLKESDTIKRFKEKHVEKDIRPFLDEGERILKDLGVEAEIEKLIVEGDPANTIIRVADEGNFSTIIMAKRGLPEIKVFFLGSATSKVVHAASRQTVYIVGQRILKDKACPVPKVLIPVDGSTYSIKGVEHAACLAGELKGSVDKITILRVINLALYMERIREGIDPEEEAKKILEEAKAVLLQAGVSEGHFSTKVGVGTPADEILKEAEEGDYHLIIVGRKGRTALKDFILGGVSSTILQRCQNPTVAIVSSR
jgi:nucleotide-binding universal stress UspA family protein